MADKTNESPLEPQAGSLPKIAFAADPELVKNQFKEYIAKASEIEAERNALLERLGKASAKLKDAKAFQSPEYGPSTSPMIGVFAKAGESEFVYSERTKFGEVSGYSAGIRDWTASSAFRALLTKRIGERFENLPPFSDKNYLEVTVKIVRPPEADEE